MAFRSNKDLKLILHPYIFVLKEGKKIQADYLDYSLLMLQVTSPEIVKSPGSPPSGKVLPVREPEYFPSEQAANPLVSREAGN